jgi:diguanylate cyclase (GGDEF)-like protein
VDTTNNLEIILDLCIKMENTAAEIYNDLSSAASSDALKEFWGKMVDDGKSHLEYWQQLQELAKKQELPDAFDNPDTILSELSERYKSIHALKDHWQSDRTVANAFVIAYRLESYKLHPAIRTLFHYYRPITTGAAPGESEKHVVEIDETNISTFVEALQKYGEVTPELELIGETLQRLWDQNKKLSRYSMLDDLTGLLNRRGFLLMARQIASLSKRGKVPVVAIALEIDKFKQINEVHGMSKGDEVIKAVGKKVQFLLRGSDLLGRFGGDEFMALLPETTLEGGIAVAEKIKVTFEEFQPADVPVTLSIGVAEALIKIDTDQELRELLRFVEGNLIIAKRNGENQIVHSVP